MMNCFMLSFAVLTIPPTKHKPVGSATSFECVSVYCVCLDAAARRCRNL